LRHRLAGEGLARHQADSLDQRRGLALGDPREALGAAALLAGGGEIAGDACHAPRAARLAARLLDGVEHLARQRAGGRAPAMQRLVVETQLQADRVGLAAHDRRLLARHLARRCRQPRFLPAQPGRLGRERDLQFGLARDRAHRGRRDLTKCLHRAVCWLRRHRVRPAQARRALPAPMSSSVPKQRW
jgi:hypothetical protein